MHATHRNFILWTDCIAHHYCSFWSISTHRYFCLIKDAWQGTLIFDKLPAIVGWCSKYPYSNHKLLIRLQIWAIASENHWISSTRELTGFQAWAIASENHWISSTRELTEFRAWAIALENHWNSSTCEFTEFRAWAIAPENHWISSTRELTGFQA